MGSLKPGATYIYENDGNIVYSREAGADPSERTVVGYSVSPDDIFSQIAEKYFFEVEWADILKESKHNPVLREAIDRVKILYHLSKKDGTK